MTSTTAQRPCHCCPRASWGPGCIPDPPHPLCGWHSTRSALPAPPSSPQTLACHPPPLSGLLVLIWAHRLLLFLKGSPASLALPLPAPTDTLCTSTHNHTPACTLSLLPHTPALAHLHEACGILSPRPGIEPATPVLEGKVLTTGLPGKSLYFLIYSPCFLPPPPSKAASENSQRVYSTAPLMEIRGRK